MRNPKHTWAGIAVFTTSLWAQDASAANTTTPGRISAPYPTVNGITLEWRIEGDEDNDGAVNVRYRRVGTARWNEAMGLKRVPAGRNAGYCWPNKHSGSIFDLAADTRYEIELSLDDPDNGSETVRGVRARTRAEPDFRPRAAATKTVTPATLASILRGALPGDIIELQAGVYGGFSLLKDGTPAAPIIMRGSSAGDVIVKGNVNMVGRRHVRLARMSVNGTVTANGSESFAIMGLSVHTASSGIVFRGCAKRGYVADNRVTGPTSWSEAALGAHGANRGEGIEFNGPGHVVRNNFVQGFRDTISFLEGAAACRQYSIDVMYNEIVRAGDDAVEADFCHHNCRVVSNRLTNTFIAMSSQPGLGGPTYFIGNAVYNTVQGPFKLHRGSTGDVIFYNTVVKNGDALGVYATAPFSRQLMLNNVFIGGPGGVYNGWSNGSGRVAYLPAIRDAHLDYNAFGSVAGGLAGQIGAVSFSRLTQLRSLTTEKNALQVDLGIFAADIAYPQVPLTEYPPQDLRIRADAGIVDTAVRIPNVRRYTKGFGPDRGAYEAGASLPIYGPRY